MPRLIAEQHGTKIHSGHPVALAVRIKFFFFFKRLFIDLSDREDKQAERAGSPTCGPWGAQTPGPQPEPRPGFSPRSPRRASIRLWI